MSSVASRGKRPDIFPIPHTTIVALLVVYLCLTLVLSSAVIPAYSQVKKHGIMTPSEEMLHQWITDYNTGARVPNATSLQMATVAPPHFDLLSHLQYTPAQRDQGWCGNCWNWASTGVLEVALDVQGIRKDRLSIQYLNSYYDVGSGPGSSATWACCGGNLNKYANFYSGRALTIPWSNTNAGWPIGSGDYNNDNCPGHSNVAASSIGLMPRIGIKQIQAQWINTQGVGQSAAIANIKNVLLQNKAIYYAFDLANDADWTDFYSFWSSQPESALWNPNSYSGHTWVNGQGGGHAVLLLGYDTSDANPANWYWIVLNSWGTTSPGRPNGFFHLKMNIDYDNYIYEIGYGNWYSLEFGTLALSFSPLVVPLTVSVSPPTSGSVSLTPAASSYTFGATVKATAKPSAGYYFAAWGLDDKYAGNSNPIPFVMNDTHSLTAYFEPQNQWVRANNNPILTPALISWDNWLVWNPRLFTYPNGTFGMVYLGTNVNGTNGIGLATSPDGLQWIKYPKPILTRSPVVGQWDNGSVIPGNIFWDGSEYVLYYEGSNPGSGRAFGYATSPDTIHWTKYPANPVMTRSTSADTQYFNYPFTLKVGGTYKMWYTSGNKISLATSPDGISWTRVNGGSAVLSPSGSSTWDGGYVYSAAVVYDSEAGTYLMSYSGIDPDGVTANTGLATSTDGVLWTKYSGNPIVALSPAGSWDSGDSVDNQGMLLWNGQLTVYYSGDAAFPVYHNAADLRSYSIGAASVSRIALRAGWNLISMPVVPRNSAVASILAQLIAAKEVSIVWSYTGTPRTWKFYKPGVASSLTMMKDGEGYWVMMTQPDTLYVGGDVIPAATTPPTYPLQLGWNLVGFKPQPAIQDATVHDYLQSIIGSYDFNNVWIYDNMNGNWIRASPDGSTRLKPGQAMWVLVTAPATLRP